MEGRRLILRLLAVLLIALLPALLFGEPQDPPDFDDHTLPEASEPAPRAWLMGVVDMAVLFSVLSLGTWFIHKTRSRKGIFWLSMFSLAYLGFVRNGCVCAIGSIQNVSQALFDPGQSAEGTVFQPNLAPNLAASAGVAEAITYAAPMVVIFYFFVPLLFSAVFGRSYCAVACPHGAIQDAVVVKPLEVPPWLDNALGLIPFIYLGLGVLFAATGSAYIICDYDPFIALFRLTGSSFMVGLGVVFLLVGTVIGRPYCRYFCPYGVLLRIFSYLSKWRVTIYPDRCIDCSLCEHSCPFGAIVPSTPQTYAESRTEGKNLLATMLLLTPLVIGATAYFGYRLTPAFANLNRDVLLARQIEKEEILLGEGKKMKDMIADNETTERSQDWRKTGEKPEAAIARGEAAYGRLEIGAWIFGAFMGMVIMVRLIVLAVRRRRPEYEAHQGSCYSCGRCYDYCPISNGIPDHYTTGRAPRI